MESKCPIWIDPPNFMPEVQLREFSASLIDKAMYVRSRIELLRRNQLGLGLNLGEIGCARLTQWHCSFYSGGIGSGVEFGVMNHKHRAVDNSKMMILMKEDDDQFVQFGVASRIQTASFIKQAFYEVIFTLNPPAQYYMPPPPPHMPPQVQGNYGGRKEEIAQ